MLHKSTKPSIERSKIIEAWLETNVHVNHTSCFCRMDHIEGFEKALWQEIDFVETTRPLFDYFQDDCMSEQDKKRWKQMCKFVPLPHAATTSEQITKDSRKDAFIERIKNEGKIGAATLSLDMLHKATKNPKGESKISEA